MKARNVRYIVVLLGVVVAASSVLGQDSTATTNDWAAPARAAKKKNPIVSDEASVAAGKTAYVQNCLSCHGEKGKGDGPAVKDLEKKPGDLSLSTMWAQTDGALFWKLSEGKKPMPSFQETLTEDSRWQVINYIRTLAPKPDTKGE